MRRTKAGGRLFTVHSRAFLGVARRCCSTQVEHPSFNSLGLKDGLLAALTKLSLTKPLPIQAAAIPPALEGKDVVASSPTGSGKTLAFVLPLLQNIKHMKEEELNKSRIPLLAHNSTARPWGLILTPTREICKQIIQQVQALDPKFSCTPIYGGIPYPKQEIALASKLDLVVGTPGRIKDHIDRGNLDLSLVRICVVDEVDHMLQRELSSTVEDLLNQTPREKQTLMFSATLPASAVRLCERFCRAENVSIQMGPEGAVVHAGGQEPSEVSPMGHDSFAPDRSIPALPASVDHHAILCSNGTSEWLQMVINLLIFHDPKRAIVFTNTRYDADEMTRRLFETGFKVQVLHSDFTQTEREKHLTDFKNGTTQVLVATDVIGRGLDVPTVDTIIQVFPPPRDLINYVHRSGRTGRANTPGVSILLYNKTHANAVAKLERKYGIPFKHVFPPSPEQIFESVVAAVEKVVSDQASTQISTEVEQLAETLAKKHGPREAFTATLAALVERCHPRKSAYTLLSRKQQKKKREEVQRSRKREYQQQKEEKETRKARKDAKLIKKVALHL